MFFNKKARKLKMRRMYMPSDRLEKVCKTRLIKTELNTVPLCITLTELKPKGE